jgi:hypothetical protein
VILLSDLRDIFNRTGADRMASADLITALLDIEESGWGEYRGVRDDQAEADMPTMSTISGGSEHHPTAW